MIKLLLKHGYWLFFILNPLFVSGQFNNAQISVNFSLPEVALVDIEPDSDNSIHFKIMTGTEAGTSPMAVKTSEDELWLNYSSALPSSSNSRVITAEVSQGSIPSGIKLFLEASGYSSHGDGQQGQAAGKIELTNQPRPVISGIGNCYTGNGIRSGHQLYFSIEITDYSELETSGEHNFVILYTLTEN
jgi:hypothetical protein